MFINLLETVSPVPMSTNHDESLEHDDDDASMEHDDDVSGVRGSGGDKETRLSAVAAGAPVRPAFNAQLNKPKPHHEVDTANDIVHRGSMGQVRHRHSKCETTHKVSKVIALGFITAALVCNARAYSLLHRHQLDQDGHELADCGDTKAWMSYGLLLQYVGFAGFVLSRSHRPNNSLWDTTVGMFLLCEIAYHLCFMLCYFHCYHLEDYIPDSFQQFLSYPLATILVSLARYEFHGHLHLETLFVLSAVLTGEITQQLVLEHKLDNQASVFTYFNVKIGLVIFEVYMDYPWTKLLSPKLLQLWKSKPDPETREFAINVLLFIFFIGSRLVQQFWYTTPSETRTKDVPEKQDYNAMIWTGCVVEVICLLTMITRIVARNQVTDRRSTTVTRAGTANQANDIINHTVSDVSGDGIKMVSLTSNDDVENPIKSGI
jgi:hypothetical protein